VVQQLKQEDGLGIWLCGGAELASELFAKIDEIILKVNPIVLGAGIPLFARGAHPASLGLLESKVFDNGFMINRYRVVR